MDDEIGGVWRTIGGRRVFIKNGQDLATAMKESGKFDESIKNNRINSLNKELKNAKGFLERAKIQNEITALEHGFNSYEEYEKSKYDKLKERAIVNDNFGNKCKVDEIELNKFVQDNNVDVKDWQNSIVNLQEIYAKNTGFASPMKLVSLEEYKNYDGLELSRVVAGRNSDEIREIVLNSKKGEIRYSNEMSSYYGRGLYYGDKKIEKKLMEQYGNKNSAIINCKISKDAKIIEVDNINDYIKKSNDLAYGIKNNDLRTFYNNPAKNRNILYMNAEIDIINVKKENYYVILNRGVLITYE